MALIFYYLGFMAAGDVAAYLLGSAVEYEWGSQVSLIVFLALCIAALRKFKAATAAGRNAIV